MRKVYGRKSLENLAIERLLGRIQRSYDLEEKFT